MFIGHSWQRTGVENEATLDLRALSTTEAQAGGGAEEEEESRIGVHSSGGRFYYMRSHIMSYFLLSKRNIIEAICAVKLFLVATLKKWKETKLILITYFT